MKKIFILPVLIVFLNACLFSQTALHLSGAPELFKTIDSTELCSIYLTTNILLKDVRITGSNDSIFTITKSDVNRTFPIAQINRVEFVQHGFWKGFAIGAGASVVFWTAMGLLTYSHGNESGNWLYGLIVGGVLALPTGLITGLINEFATNNAVYDFKDANSWVKARRLKYIRSKHIY